ncbi:unnamed protein product [Lactuca virosa]|uniref:Uncharacterized protein n=1 Tax=Lactuca virosa TaxID=75947 RepID=A0AAU9N694_9ASTR|nr:unnamed protein product [Lactuca virosa]
MMYKTLGECSDHEFVESLGRGWRRSKKAWRIILKRPLYPINLPEAFENLRMLVSLKISSNQLQVHGFVEDVNGKKHATVFGKWDDNMYYINGITNVKPKDMSDAYMLWQRTLPPVHLTR